MIWLEKLEFLPELVIFDLDGTLIEFHHDYLYNQTLKALSALGYEPVDTSVLEASFQAFDYFRFMEPKKREGFKQKFWEWFDWENFPRPVPIQGSNQALEKLTKRGIRTAITTSRKVTREALRELLSHTGFLEHLSSVSARLSDDVHWTDKTGLVLDACEELGVAPELTAFVGDSPTDISSAQAVGLGITVAVLSGGIRRDILEQVSPSVILPDVSKLPEALFDSRG